MSEVFFTFFVTLSLEDSLIHDAKQYSLIDGRGGSDGFQNDLRAIF